MSERVVHASTEYTLHDQERMKQCGRPASPDGSSAAGWDFTWNATASALAGKRLC